MTKKLQQKSSWFKKSGQEDCYVGGKKPSRGNDKKKPKEPAKTAPKKKCIFVEYTHQGALAKKLREVAQRLEHILGFAIKVVEKAGPPLISQFPTDAWDNTPCGREDCITCTQGAEQIPPCTKKSAIYENVCSKCNKRAGSKEPVVQTNIEIPSIYVGETSRSIKERGGEHIAAYRSSNKDSHIFKHQSMEHPGEEPEFILGVASFHKTALGCQVGEAVRIKRRGGQGAVLNSKAEFDRCRIPRLVLEEQDLEQADKLELEREEQLAATLDKEHNNWEQTRIRNRTMEHLEMMKTKEQYNYKTKRTKELPKREGKTRKRRRIFTIIGEDWGAAKECNLDIREDQLQLDPELHNNMEQPPTPPHTSPAVLELPKTPPSPSPPKVTHSSPPPQVQTSTQNTQCSPEATQVPSPSPNIQKKPLPATPRLQRLGGSRKRGSPILSTLGLAKRGKRVPLSLAGRPSPSRTSLCQSPNEIPSEEPSKTVTESPSISAGQNWDFLMKSSAKNASTPLKSTSRRAKNSKLQQNPPQVSVKEMIKRMNRHTEEMDNILKQEEQEDKLSKQSNQNKQEEQEQSITNQRGENQSQGGIATSSESPPPTIPCEFNKHGFCKTHKILGKQIEVSKSSWKDRGKGKGFGFVKTKVKKFICSKRNVPVVSQISHSNNHATSSITSRLAMSGRESKESSRTHNSECMAARISDESDKQGLEKRKF